MFVDYRIPERNPFEEEEGFEEPEEESVRWKAITSAFAQDSFTGNIWEKVESSVNGGDIDVDYDALENKDYLLGLKDQGRLQAKQVNKILEKSTSKESYLELLREELSREENAKALDSLGWEGYIYRIGAGITDGVVVAGATALAAIAGPIAAGVTAVAGATAAFYKKLGLGAKASNVLAKGTLGVGIEGALEAPKQIDDIRDRDEIDLLISGVAGFWGGQSLAFPKELGEVPMERVVQSVDEEVSAISELSTPQAREDYYDSKYKKIIDEKLQIDQLTVLSTTGVPEMDELAKKLFYNPRKITTEGDYAAAEYNIRYYDNIQGSINRNYNSLYLEYVDLTRSSKLSKRLNIDLQEDFFQYAGKLRYGKIDEAGLSDEWLEFNKKVRQANSNLATEAYDYNVNIGHRSFIGEDAIPKDPDYMPISYRLDKFFVKNHTEKDFNRLIEASLRATLERSGKEVNEKLLKEKAQGWTKRSLERYNKRANLSFEQKLGIDNRIDTIKETTEALLSESDDLEDILEALDIAQRVAKGVERPKPLSGRAAYRSNIALDVPVIAENGEEIRLGDFLEYNVQRLWQGYGNSVGGDIALQKVGFNSRSEIVEFRKQLEKSLLAKEGISQPIDLSKNSVKILQTFEDVMSQFLGQATIDSKNSIMQDLVYLSGKLASLKLGTAFWAMSLEVSRVANEVTVKSLMKSLPAFKHFVKGYSGKQADAITEEIRAFISLNEHSFSLPQTAKYEDLYVDDLKLRNDRKGVIGALEKAYEKTGKYLTAAQEATFQLGGIKSLTGLLEHFYTSAMMSNIHKAVRGGKINPQTIEEMGWNRETFSRIKENLLTNMVIDDNGKLVKYNLGDWDNATREAFIMGMRRQAQVMVQRVLIGDHIGLKAWSDTLYKNSVFGQLSMQLKSYMITAHSKQLSRDLMNFDKKRFVIWTSAVATGVAAYMAKNYVNTIGDEERRKEAFKNENIAKGVVSTLPFSAFLPSAVDSVIGVGNVLGADIDPVFSQGQRGVTTFSPTFDLVDDALKGDTSRVLKSFYPNVFGTTILARRIEEALEESDRGIRLKPKEID